MSAFNSSSSLDDELLEDAAPPPPPPPAFEEAEVLCVEVEVDVVPLLDALVDELVVLLSFEFDDAAPEEAPLPAPLVEACAPVP
ncbi:MULTISPECIES: hypothetical protein [unclassified Paraburkholderia]|uniref:hypothetical protein n=1 Tax=unclassified Paraburkholderia TaxID=2615204 RepID=UPI0020B6743B|nr:MULTISPECIES: hypothetical protein [unclassified Paraburkholderia]MCP3717510.1 hypothetical protein [Paraburkholderia sp. CNPSo 3281]MCX5538000.1 hypothetical protein [Paraburkholderia sp. CNPSo 3076]